MQFFQQIEKYMLKMNKVFTRFENYAILLIAR